MIELLHAALLCLAQEPAPSYAPKVEEASDETRTAVDKLELADGLSATLWAAEPMLANPVCLYMTNQGDLYVAETFRHYAGVTDMRDHMDWLDDELAARSVADRVEMFKRRADDFGWFTKDSDRIRLLRDVDRDGRADVSVVFADQFFDPASGIGAGLLERRGDVYFTNIPDLWRLRDQDKNGRADVQEKLSTGYGVHVAYLGHDLHGLRIGPDGKLYFSCGDRGLRVETPNGVIDAGATGAVLRCNLDGSDLELYATGLRNPQELAFDEYGNLFTGDNNSDGGDQARWVYVLPGSDSGWRFHYQHLTEPWLRGPWNDELLWKPHFAGQAAYVLPPVENVAHGPSGLTYHPGTGLDPSWKGRFFLCEFEGDPRWSGVLSFAIEPKGAGFALKGEVQQTIWNVCVTDVDFGPDGALYLCDWVFGWQKTGKGRVFRVQSKDAASASVNAETRDVLGSDFASKPLVELGTLLAHADQRVRLEAQLELASRGDDGHAILSSTVKGTVSQLARLHSLWGLGIVARRDPRAIEELRSLLVDEETEVRAQAARVLGDLRDARSSEFLIALLADASPRVRCFAALALARLGAASAIDPLFALARETGESDPWLRHAAIEGLARCADDARLAAAVDDPSVDARVAAVVALRRRASSLVARFLGDTDARVVTEAARAIYDLNLTAGFDDLADLIGSPRIEGNALVRRVLHANYRLGGSERPKRLAEFALRDGANEKLRAEALSLLERWLEPEGRDLLTGEWRPLEKRESDRARLVDLVVWLEKRGIATRPVELRSAWTKLVASYHVESSSDVLARWASDAKEPAHLRAASLQALATLGADAALAVLRQNVLDVDGEVRAAAIAGLQRVAPGEALPILRTALASADPRELRVAYAGLAKLDDPAANELLATSLDALDRGLVPAEVALDLVQAAEKKGGVLGERLKARLAARAESDASLAPYLDSLHGGDPERGRALFREKTEVTCLKCHRIEDAGEGGNVGPVLRGLSSRSTRLAVLESIVEPNRKIARGYDAVQFVTVDEEVLEGRILSETPDAIRVLDAEGNEHELHPADVAARRPALSAMPSGLAQHLSASEMRDLVAFLANL
ncbi:MAG: HEAT repeat domain-containing protein [Planctomycetes bacterium]|nr:HEAT repeat domain-containing protein [Planctomycetota bacterium]